MKKAKYRELHDVLDRQEIKEAIGKDLEIAEDVKDKKGKGKKKNDK